MNDFATLTAQPRALIVGSQRYLVYPLTLADWGQLQAWVDAQFPDPFEVMADALEKLETSTAQQQLLFKLAMEAATKARRKIGTPEADAVLQSIEGFCQMLLVSIRKGQPDFSEAGAQALFQQMTLGQLRLFLCASEAEHVLADPPTPAPGAEAGQAGSTSGVSSIS